MMYCGDPLYLARSSGHCVAMPVQHWLVWHLRSIMQPSTIISAVAKPYSSAPSNALTMTSRPFFSCPSACKRTLPRRWLSISVCCASAKPISMGSPAYTIELKGDAPVPPSLPLMSMTSALALATPAAMVPTPVSDTNLTLMRACGLTFFRS